MRSQPPDSLFAFRRAAIPSDRATSAPALDLLLDVAKESYPGTHIGVSVVSNDGVLTTLAATTSLVFALDLLQHELAEGPSLTSAVTGHTVIVDDVESEQRWHAFTRRAVDFGLCSALVLPLSMHNKTLGVVNLYSQAHAPLSAQSLERATLFASQAAIVVSQAQREQQLLHALQSGPTVGAAIGMVMERFCIDEDEAHAYLQRLSQGTGVTLLELCAQFVQQSNDRWASRGKGSQPLPRNGAQRLTVLASDGLSEV